MKYIIGFFMLINAVLLIAACASPTGKASVITSKQPYELIIDQGLIPPAAEVATIYYPGKFWGITIH